MDELRKPVFVVALVLALLVVLVETGAWFFTEGKRPLDDEMRTQLAQIDGAGDLFGKFRETARGNPAAGHETPPGMAILQMAVLDGLLLYSVCMIGAGFVLTDRVVGRLQGVVSFVVSVAALIFVVLGIFAAIGKTMLMVGLFTATPFVSIVYMVGWGFFDRADAAVVLGLLLLLKLGFAGCLVVAHQRFLQNKGLVMMIFCSLLANVIISFLHNLVPVFLVSITDAIGGIIVLVLAAIWAVLMLIGAIIAVVKTVF